MFTVFHKKNRATMSFYTSQLRTGCGRVNLGFFHAETLLRKMELPGVHFTTYVFNLLACLAPLMGSKKAVYKFCKIKIIIVLVYFSLEAASNSAPEM